MKWPEKTHLIKFESNTSKSGGIFLYFPEVLTHSPVLPNTQFDFIQKEFLTIISDYPLRRSKMWF